MSEQDEKNNVRYILATSDTIRDIFYKIYHNPIFEKKPFDYDKLKGNSKILEDAVRTAFFAGFHEAETHYELQKMLDLINNEEKQNA